MVHHRRASEEERGLVHCRAKGIYRDIADLGYHIHSDLYLGSNHYDKVDLPVKDRHEDCEVHGVQVHGSDLDCHCRET